MAQSSLVDKETGRIFWEGGTHSTLTASLASRISRFGWWGHVPALFMSVLAWVAVYGCIHSLLLLQTQSPAVLESGFPTWILVLAIVLYFVEAYFCQTHQFLSHQSDSHTMERLLEQLRLEEPQVTWIVRSFHYEPWPVVALLLRGVSQLQRRWSKSTTTEEDNMAMSPPPSTTSTEALRQSVPMILQRKRISQRSERTFTLSPDINNGYWQDSTTAGVWTRAVGRAPLAQLFVTQVVMLGNPAARAAYLQQQSQFVQTHTDRDSWTEFATRIHIPGFQSSTLLVQRTTQPSSATETTSAARLSQWFRKLWYTRQTFWLCTLLGCSAFYRIWMARHCDVIRVSLVKEAIVDPYRKRKSSASSFSSWWSLPALSVFSDRQKSQEATAQLSAAETKNTEFQNLMQQLEVYNRRPVVTTTPDNEKPVSVVTPSPNVTATNDNTTTPTTSSTQVSSLTSKVEPAATVDATRNETLIEDETLDPEDNGTKDVSRKEPSTTNSTAPVVEPNVPLDTSASDASDDLTTPVSVEANSTKKAVDDDDDSTTVSSSSETEHVTAEMIQNTKMDDHTQ